MTASHRSGFINGTGAAINIELGWIPDTVIVVEATTGSPVNIGYPSAKIMAFTSGGTNEIKAGHYLKGATSGARARVRQVILDTGTWAGGDAAGWFILDADTETGTFASESVYYEGSSGTNDGTGAATAYVGVDIDTEVAADTGISAYVGAAGTNSKGFTLATGISVDAKLLAWTALRNIA